MPNVKIGVYVDNIVVTEDGDINGVRSAWIVVPKEWAKHQAKLMGYPTWKQFIEEYTHDDTDGWFKKAIKDAVLIGFGAGATK